jgi:hypothetical protein
VHFFFETQQQKQEISVKYLLANAADTTELFLLASNKRTAPYRGTIGTRIGN